LINFVDATNDANHYTKPPPSRLGSRGARSEHGCTSLAAWGTWSSSWFTLQV